MGQQRGWGQLRRRGPGAMAVLMLAGSGLVAALFGYRLPVVASRPSRLILALLLGACCWQAACSGSLLASRKVATRPTICCSSWLV
jgi:hypothetical protein